MRYFPAFVDLKDGACLVVGGGAAALAKLRLLGRTEARLTVVAPKVVPEIEALAWQGRINWYSRRFEAGDLENQTLVFTATGLDAVDDAVSRQARALGLQVNAVDRPEGSSFITPAIVDRDPVVIGISSAGTAPVLARQIRGQIEALLPAGLGALARFAASFRPAVRGTIDNAAGRRHFWERFFGGPLARGILKGDGKRAREEMLSLINRARPSEYQDKQKGAVAIVGAGPGDPDLLTFKALRRLQEADVVVYDNLVSAEIMNLARREAKLIHAGKAKGRHSMAQAEINAVMLREVRAGKRIVRLKGGDPFVFGRGGEELAYLQAQGIEAEVVPGITAATGCASAAGIPLTQRGLAQAVTFVTGHGASVQGKTAEPDLDWAALARLNQTLCIYMGLSTAGAVAGRLMEQGLAGSTPAAVIENGTLANQRVLRGRLDQIAVQIENAGLTGPAMIVIGAVTAEVEQAAGDLRPLAV